MKEREILRNDRYKITFDNKYRFYRMEEHLFISGGSRVDWVEYQLDDLPFKDLTGLIRAMLEKFGGE